MERNEMNAKYAVPDAAARTIMRPEDIAAADAAHDMKANPNCRDVAGNAIMYLQDTVSRLRALAGERPCDVTDREAPNGSVAELRQQLDGILRLSSEIVALVTEIQMQV